MTWRSRCACCWTEWPDARPRLSHSAHGDGAGIHSAVYHAACGGNAQRNPAPARASPPDDAGAGFLRRNQRSPSRIATGVKQDVARTLRSLYRDLLPRRGAGGGAADRLDRHRLPQPEAAPALRELEESGVVRRSGPSATGP
jgi:hypothetical protein